jgi:hypothetical protein
MVVKVWEYDEEKLFKIAKLNLHGKAKDWCKRLNLTPLDLQTLWILMMAKYEVYDGEELKVKMDGIRFNKWIPSIVPILFSYCTKPHSTPNCTCPWSGPPFSHDQTFKWSSSHCGEGNIISTHKLRFMFSNL